MSEITPEPWTLTKDGKSIIQTHHITRDVWVIPHSDGDMARIVECVNTCAGIEDVAKALDAARFALQNAILLARMADRYEALDCYQEALDGLGGKPTPPLPERTAK